MIKNILLAEDERGTALLVKTHLERQGYVVHVAQDGLQALEVLKEQRVDLVITDVVMPNMDGVDLYLALKNDKKMAKIPIIIVTDKQVFLDSFASLGVNHFIPKTSDVKALAEKIKSVEKQGAPDTEYHKVLVCGGDAAVLVQMQTLLRERQCLVSSAKTTLEIVSKAIEMKPHLVVMDVMIHDTATTAELIRSLKCYAFLSHTKIVTYSYFLPEELSGASGFIHGLENAMKESLEAGAVKYWGRFNRVTFLEQIEEFGIK